MSQAGLALDISPIPGPAPPPYVHVPYSGRYEATDQLGPSLVLRVDIDVRYANSPVMKCVSGDTYKQAFVGNLSYRVYDKSWIVLNPTVSMSNSQVEITGDVKYWKFNPAFETALHIKIPRSLSTGYVGPATVTLTPEVGQPSTYTCKRKSDCFRAVTLEVDVAKSVNQEPILPKYNTDSHPLHPADIPPRALTVQKAYREAGICLTINPLRTIIDDTASEFISWSDAELHDAMESYFSKYATIARWDMWCMFCKNYDLSTVIGVMFDYGARYGGPGISPERQGFALFRGHGVFDDLVSNPTTNNQLDAMRQLLRTYVHEAGHAFGFSHSWDKGRPDSLSWMNYPGKYPCGDWACGDSDAYWQEFRFMFDEEELIHLRHGDRAAVIMGGDPWVWQAYSQTPYDLEISHDAMSQLEGQAPIELLLRSQDYFEYLEPIEIEVRVRNLLSQPVIVDSRLNPQYGNVTVYIRRPNGRIVRYVPATYKEGTPNLLTLESHNSNTQGEDRFSDYVALNYGKYGFYFDEPGEYLVRAIYQTGFVGIPSNTLRIRVGYPTSNEESRIAKDFFTYQVGMSIYLNGSQSPFLSAGKSLLESLSKKYKKTLVGSKISTVLAASEARPFFRIQDNNVLTQTHKPNYEKALNLTEPVVELYRTQKDKPLNIPYHLLVRSRANYLAKIGQKKEANSELSDLRNDLKARGVKESVLKSIESFQESIEKGPKKRTKKR